MSVNMTILKNRDEWLKNRRKGIGGSEISAVIGCNPYLDNVTLWELKTGRKVPEDISDKPESAKDAEICRNANILENYSINEQYKDELKTILQATDFDSAEARVIKIRYKQKDNRYTNFFRNFKFFYNKICELSDSQLNSIALRSN